MNCVFMSCPESRYHIPPLIEPVIVDDLLRRVEGDDVLLGLLAGVPASAGVVTSPAPDRVAVTPTTTSRPSPLPTETRICPSPAAPPIRGRACRW